MTAPVRVAVVQMRSGTDPEANLAAIARDAAEARAGGASYVLTPEMSVLFAENRDMLQARTEPAEGNNAIARLSEIARQAGLYLHVGSLPIAREDGRFANRSMLFAPDGATVASYDKVHLFDANIPGQQAYRESATYAGGDEAVVARLPLFSLGFSICYDMRFPRLYNALANAGASLMAVPAAFTVPTGQAHWHVLLRARAIETGSYVIAAAQGGSHANGRATYGHSLVIDPWGKIIAELDHDRPGVLVAEIDPAAVTEARRRVPACRAVTSFSSWAAKRSTPGANWSSACVRPRGCP